MAGFALIHRDITDENGNILDGAIVTVREGHAPGGGLAELFLDDEGTQPVGNPITLDGEGSGSPSVGVLSVYVSPGPYRLEGTATAGNGFAPVDAIAIPSQNYATFAAFVAAVAAGFEAPDSTIIAAGPAWFQAEGSAEVDGLPDGWRPFGPELPEHWADNTTHGVTDMTAAINAAVAYGNHLGCDLLDRDYLISGPILITGREPNESSTEAFRFVGRGPGVSRVINSTPETDWLTVSKGGGLRDGWISGIIRDVSFISDLSNRPTAEDHGAAIRLKRALKVKIRDVEIDASTYPIYQENAGMTEVSNLYVRNSLMATGETGHSLFTFAGGPGGRCFGQEWSDIEAQAGESWDKGFDILGVDGLYVSNSHINNVADRVHIRPNGAGGEDRCLQVQFSNTYFDGNGLSGTGDGFVFAPDMPHLDIDIPASDVTPATDVMVASNNGILDGAVVRFTSTGALPGGLSAGTNYWVLSLGQHSFRLATTYENWRTNVYVDITSAGTGTHTLTNTPDDIIRISGIQKTGGLIRRGTNALRLSGQLRGLSSISDIQINGVEFQDFESVWLSVNSAALVDPLEQIQNVKVSDSIFEVGAISEDNSNLFVIVGQNISFTNNIIQGDWTDEGQVLYNILEESDNVFVYGNIHDVPRTNALANINANAGRVVGLTRSNANGSYIMRPDGTMQCRHVLELPYQSASVCWADWTYPSPDFKEAPTVTVTIQEFTGTVSETSMAATRIINKTATGVRVRQPRVVGAVDFEEAEVVDAEVLAEGTYE